MFNEYEEMAKELDHICENGKYQEIGLAKGVYCNKKHENCTFIRWCRTDNCIKMTEKSLTCPYRGE